MDGPLVDPNSQLKYALNIIDIVTTFLFVAEGLFKIISVGLVANGPWSYLR